MLSAPQTEFKKAALLQVAASKPTVRCIRGGGSADAEAVEIKPMVGHVLLGLEHDDVDLGSEHAAQDHEAAQADRDAHGCGLNLQSTEDGRQRGAVL